MRNLNRCVGIRRQSRANWKYFEALELRALLSATIPAGGYLLEPSAAALVATLGGGQAAAAITSPSASSIMSPLATRTSTTLTLTLVSGSPCGATTFHVAATGSPSGIVDLFDGTVWRAAATMTNGSVNISPSFTFHGGSHTFTAYFHGDNSYAPATSAPLSVNLTPVSTTTTLTTSATSASELQAVVLTATVTCSLPAMGKVTFYDQGTALGSAFVDIFGKAKITCNFNNYGTHALTASFAGMADEAASTSATVSEVITRTPRQLTLRATDGTSTQSVLTVAAGTNFNLTVSELDCKNTLFETGTCSIALTIVAATGPGTLAGTVTGHAVNGVATFTGLSITQPGTYTLRATDGSKLFGDLPGLVVTPAATHLGFVAATSSSTIAGQIMAPVTVQFLDAANHVVPMNAPVTISLTNANGATLAGATTVNAVLGTAVFTNLALGQAGNYTFTATADGVKIGISKAFTIVPDAASAHLVIATQPADSPLGSSLTAIVVNVVDRFNNPVLTDSSTVTLALASSPQGATLTGALSAKVSKGVAKFTGIKVDQIGDYSLTVSDGAMTPLTTNTFKVYTR